MGKDRLAAFGDGVIAITIMVLELRVPHGADLALAIYWNNHRLFCRITRRLVGRTRTEAPGIEDEAVAPSGDDQISATVPQGGIL
jgi:uncharacterized membrane protein